jgi:hypothetical protein
VADRILHRLAHGGRTGVFLAALVVILIALLSPGWIGGLLTIIVVALLAALMGRTWSVQPPATRAVRIVVLLVLTVFAIVKVTH